jgi:hypothetical protein
METKQKEQGDRRKGGAETGREDCDSETCLRCHGLMVREVCLDLFNSRGEIDCLAARCVQCGEIVDSVILGNRRRQRTSVAGEGLSVESVSVPVAA